MNKKNNQNNSDRNKDMGLIGLYNFYFTGVEKIDSISDFTVCFGKVATGGGSS